MTFSSLVFLCIFFPIVFCLHLVVPSIKVKNILLIIASLLFYAFGEPVYVFLMLFSAFFNYLCAKLMGSKAPASENPIQVGEKATAPDGEEKSIEGSEPLMRRAKRSEMEHPNAGKRKALLVLAVVINIGLLCVFKYTGLFLNTINDIAKLNIPVPAIALPIGISFFTFQALSYVIDVYRGQVGVQKSFPKVLLYISFFPQLIAGPIVKYRDIAEEIENREVKIEEVAPGLRRFILGLGKKVLIANAMAVVADNIFTQDVSSLNILSAWIGAAAYALQIYFDFSGYSDMAIGLGRMFGFHFRENFDHPYISRNIKEFWRRWHISLSSWFKDYVYIPLGGNRKGSLRTGINKIIVFFLTGLWHGANWTFVVWGLFHGFFSFLEEFIPALRKLPKVISNIYLMVIVIVGFVIFRADNMTQALGVIGKMFTGFNFDKAGVSLAMEQLTPYFIVMLIAAAFGAGGIQSLAFKVKAKLIQSSTGAGAKAKASTYEVNGAAGDASNLSNTSNSSASKLEGILEILSYLICVLILIWCILRLSGGSYNPFIYFRF